MFLCPSLRIRDLPAPFVNSEGNNVIEIEQTVCGWTDVRMDRHLRPASLG